MDEYYDSQPRPPRRLGYRISGAFAILAMGSWVVLAAIPMVVAIVALT